MLAVAIAPTLTCPDGLIVITSYVHVCSVIQSFLPFCWGHPRGGGQEHALPVQFSGRLTHESIDPREIKLDLLRPRTMRQTERIELPLQ